MAVADFNCDGYPGIAFSDELCCLSVAAGNGSGQFESSALYKAPKYPRAIFAADFQATGQLDLAVIDGASVALFPGQAGGKFGTPLTSGAVAANGAVADFNGDGIPDLAVAGNNPAQLQVLFGQKNGNFVPAATHTDLTVQVAFMAAADFNGDGIPDIALSTSALRSTPGGIQVLLGDGKGNFTVSATIREPSSAFGQIVAADCNGDGKIDLAVADHTSKRGIHVVAGEWGRHVSGAGDVRFGYVWNQFSDGGRFQ